MGRITTVSAVVLTILSFGAPAMAQGKLNQPLTRMPSWDAGGSIGWHWGTETELGESEGDNWLTQGQYRLDLGRYWTPHLKTELGFSTTNEWHSFEIEPVPLAGLRGGGYAYTDRRLRLAIFSPAVTYQFLHNSLMHPYVTGGMRINESDHRSGRGIRARRRDDRGGGHGVIREWLSVSRRGRRSAR